MAYGTAPTSGGSGDPVTTDSITKIDGVAGSSYGEAQIAKIGYGGPGDLNVISSTQPLPVTPGAFAPYGLPVDSDNLNKLIGATSNNIDNRSLLDVLDPLSDNYVAPQAEAVGSNGRVLQQTVDNALLVGLVDRQYSGVSVASGTVMFTAPCADMNYILLTMVASATASVQIETLLPDGSWQAVFAQVNGASVSTSQGQSIANSGTQAAWATAHLGGASWVRVRSTTANTIRVVAKLTNTPPPAMLYVFQQVTGTASTLSCTNTPLAPTAATNLNSAATTNATSVKASAGRIFVLTATNNGAAVCFLKLYNKASAPTVGTDTPVAVMSIPANGVPLVLEYGALGLQFSTGIAFAITNLVGDADTTAIAAGQVKLMMSYV